VTPAELVFPITVGKCIYCRSTEGLSSEHVIPFGLSGTWELLQASCKAHRDTTSAIEGRVLGWGLADAREKLGLRTRRPKQRTGIRTLVYHTGDETRTDDVSVAEHHGGFVLPVLPVLTAPTYLTGEMARDLPGVVALRSCWHTASLRRLAERLGTNTMSFRYVHEIDLARMLAKIGYAFAVGYLKGAPEAFEDVYVLRTILEGPNAGHYVGCTPQVVNPDGPGHRITLVETDRELVVYIRLFGPTWPEYTIVVGRRRELSNSIAA
jgi:hypothetical protein